MGWLSPEFLAALTPWSLLLLLVLLNMLGYIRPARAVKEAREYGEQRAAAAERETERWRLALIASEQARDNQDAAVKEALDIGRTAVQVVEGLRRAVAAEMREVGREMALEEELPAIEGGSAAHRRGREGGPAS